MGVHYMGIAKFIYKCTSLTKSNVKKSLLRRLRREIQEKLALQPSIIFMKRNLEN